MKVIKAEAMGFCFGVRDALAAARSVEQPHGVTIHGELVHNPIVLHQLDVRGFQTSSETDRDIPSTERVLITAHGISDVERDRLTNAGKTLIDTTCPLVKRVHDAAQKFDRQGALVIVIGRPGHVEVAGIVEDLANYVVVPDVDSVTHYNSPNIGIVSQSTMPPDKVNAIRAQITRKNIESKINFANTVCQPTIDRQNAVDHLADQVDLVVVVGGRNSNNTRQLVHRIEAKGKTAFHIESADELRPDWFIDADTVGLTAGTSTPDSVIDEVAEQLKSMSSSAQELNHAHC